MLECSTLIRGDPRQPSLIFLHGFLGCKEDWEEMIPFFVERYFCMAIDLPGHGQSPYSEPLLSALKPLPPKPILIGYSMGGRIALQLQECARAVVALSAHPGLASDKERTERRASDAVWTEKLLKMPFEAFLEEWYAQPMFQGLAKNPTFLQKRLQQNPSHLAKVMQQMSLAAQPHITQFSCPTLFVHGEEDLKYRQLYCKLPDTVSVRSITHCGHAVHLENAKNCSEHILNWLEITHANA
jgi:2-succinyl-6-hydroxy-2,4-cyclohexadiene-1-carboxylate synthase